MCHYTVTSEHYMKKEETNENNDGVLSALLEDPTRSLRQIAQKLGSYRQKIWRKKKQLEQKNIIWGYTAVVDDCAQNHVLYITLLTMKPISKDLVYLITNRVTNQQFKKQQIRLINVLFVNGQYDWVITFSAPDHATARRYYDSLRIAYEPYLLEKPVIIDVNFSLIREGKINPNIHNLKKFIPR